MDDEIEIPIRLENDVALKLAMFAHDVRVTLNDLVVNILEDSAAGWALRRRRGSRRDREGVYVGKCAGKHYRAHNPATALLEGGQVFFSFPIPSATVAFNVYMARTYPPARPPSSRQQVIDAYRARENPDG